MAKYITSNINFNPNFFSVIGRFSSDERSSENPIFSKIGSESPLIVFKIKDDNTLSCTNGNGDVGIISTTFTITNKTEYVFAITRNGTNWKLYIDGVLIDNVVDPTVIINENLGVNIGYDQSINFLGTIGDLLFYDEVSLSLSEIININTSLNNPPVYAKHNTDISVGNYNIFKFGTRDGIQDITGNYTINNNNCIVGKNINFLNASYLEIPEYFPKLRELTINAIISIENYIDEFNICSFGAATQPTINSGIKIKYQNGNLYVICTSFINSTYITHWGIVYPFDPILNGKHLITVTWDGTTSVDASKLYVNAEHVASDTPDSLPEIVSSHPLRIGADSVAGFNTNGSIDKIEIYEEEKSAGWVLNDFSKELRFW